MYSTRHNESIEFILEAFHYQLPVISNLLFISLCIRGATILLTYVLQLPIAHIEATRQ